MVLGGASLTRRNIKRINNRFEKRVDGIDEFAKETANNLLEKYPDIDFYDLMYLFEISFRYQYSVAMLIEEDKILREEEK